ncbi:MAG: thiamine phosphate synthase [Bacteroidota bacterium]
MISRLHYISQASKGHTHLDAIRAVCEAGASCVQLRIKHQSSAAVLPIAQEVQEYCSQKGVQLVINDHVDMARQLGAYGLHVGKQDMPPQEARMIVGPSTIIGGTANSWEDIVRLAEAKVDYIGLGPFRFTTTKDVLSPILGLAGYRDLIQACKEHDIHIPILAIGGIRLPDISPLMETGIHGVAISGYLTRQPEMVSAVQKAISTAIASPFSTQ